MAAMMAAPVQAQQGACANRADVIKHLSDQYQETPVARGIASNGGVLEILSSPNGSFTVIVTLPSGISCLLASGENWQNLERVVPGRDG